MKIIWTVFEKFESFMKSREKKRHDCRSSRKFFPTPKHPVRAIGISGVECNSSSTCVLHDVEHVADHVDIFSEHEEGTHTQVAEVLEVLAVLGFGGIVALKVYNTHSTQINNSGQQAKNGIHKSSFGNTRNKQGRNLSGGALLEAQKAQNLSKYAQNFFEKNLTRVPKTLKANLSCS